MQVIVALVLSLPNVGAYAMLAVGIVMIYRASKVLNLAHGAMVMIPPYVVYSLSGWGLPAYISAPLGVVAGGLLGYGVERIFVRRLRPQGVTAQTVGTVAALGLGIAGASKIWGTTQLPAVRVFPEGFITVSRSSIQYGEIGIFLVMLVVTGVLILLFQRTDLGLLMRGTAENRRAASLMGVDPDRITAVAWILGGALAGLSGIMLASNTNLNPFTLSNQALPAFVAALIAGLASPIGAVVGAGVVGASAALISIVGPLGELEGAEEFVLFIVAIVVMATRGSKLVGGQDVRAELSHGGARDGGGGAKLPGGRPATILGVLLLVAFPFLASGDILNGANTAARLAIVATSLVLLTGWVGQISLGHAALVGVGAYATGWLSGGMGIPFPLNLPAAGLVAAGVAVLLGAVAVRVRGLYLAVATLIFSWSADRFLFLNATVTKHFRIDLRNIGGEGSLPYFDFTDRRVIYFMALAIAGLGLYAAANLRDSKTGRALFAVRGSEIAASSLGIDVVKYKVLAFAVSGFLAGTAGNLVMTESRAISPQLFDSSVSFFFLSIVVVGGVASLGGALAAAVLFGALEVLFFRVTALGGFLPLASAGLLTVTLLAYSGGFAKAGAAITSTLARFEGAVNALRAADRALVLFVDDVRWLRNWIRARTRQRLELAGLAVPATVPAAAPMASHDPPIIAGGSPEAGSRLASLASAVREKFPTSAPKLPAPARLDFTAGSGERPPLAPNRAERPLVLKADEITVRFGGLVAVSENTLEVREGEIVGLIGPNGAGKTVSFNTIAGIVTPTSGRVELYGRDVTDMPVHVRAQMGVARTFQAIQLISQLTVFDNLLVATHLQNPTGFLAHVFVTDEALAEEERAKRTVRKVIEILELEDVAHQLVADLPFGILRMVEVARAMVTGFRFLMLDEPASGLDSSETERLTEVLLRVRDLGVTLLLIEHDVKMVTSVSDYMYVLERGRLIAEGPPDVVKRDPAVIAAYLGQGGEE